MRLNGVKECSREVGSIPLKEHRDMQTGEQRPHPRASIFTLQDGQRVIRGDGCCYALQVTGALIESVLMEVGQDDQVEDYDPHKNGAGEEGGTEDVGSPSESRVAMGTD